MTLILTLLNRDQAVLVSDRRVTVNGRLIDPKDNERNKAGVLITSDARVAFAFTGLARWETFNTELWLLETLSGSAPPDFRVGPLIDRFAQRAGRDFAQLKAADKRLSIVFAGYVHEGDRFRPYLWRVSNFEGALADKPSKMAGASFTIAYAREPSPPPDVLGLTLPAGWTVPIQKRRMEDLHRFVLDQKPAGAIVGKALDVVRDAARAASSKGMIGEACTSIILPKDPSSEAVAKYHAGDVTTRLGGVAYVEATGDPNRGRFIIKMDALELVGATGRPIQVVPKVGRNQPCPCGRGKKYKSCHGKHRRDGPTISFGSDA